ncbi:ABC transporter permease [Ketogulonicigenium vulgare]|uniref:ABC transporter-like protein permease n=1 Tax=Ketogulonicigenium vulgare (strain WSH-001) TaxID=759362 RepID=F9Y9N5_KETVW|nr:ABC transporter permease subunit [Ketogulonicigenium vulgare]ADO41338.1 binding-protein-dependent transport systems inner membrane component [Ketogulonicigenium vulgare Y25]AEM41373.1 ABC transporter-like protein permease [Ketogulonicigenium vulgare WSH-001]ALJ81511.1 ABC transporter [Ketogulonicigenium vulgare]ANW34219.1 ABC transporter [Ketogulonicigenium vulgare]AOZ55118.1 binding-protein-dependent transporters inner membrane component [Ketogulonicigenium vulgare]
MTFLSRNWPILLLLAIWQLGVSLSGLNSIVLPAPLPVLMDMLGNPGLYAVNTLQTLWTAFAGLLIGSALGVLVACLAYASRFLAGVLTPFGLIFSSVPVVALIPIIARILGYGSTTVIAIVAIAAFFPTFVFVGKGLQQLPRGADDLMRVLGAGRLKRFSRLVLPSAVPDMMIALRLIVPESVLAAILAEYLMGRSGLGYVFAQATSRFAMERAFGVSLVVTLTAVLCFFLAHRAERAVKARWS